jgi:TatD DNase family protein
MLSDSHAHLTDPQLASRTEEILKRAGDAGVTQIVCVATDLASSRAVLELAQRFPDTVRPTLGIHPHQTAGAGAGDWPELERLGHKEPLFRAVGETGLDYLRDDTPPERERQQEGLRRQIRLALELDKPIILHNRQADEDILRVLREEGRGKLRGVFHCFTGDAALAREVIGLGFHCSFSGILTYPKSEPLRQTARQIPLDRILIETDAPYLAPVPHRGKANEPAYLFHTATCLAETLRLPIEKIAETTRSNTATLFGLPTKSL